MNNNGQGLGLELDYEINDRPWHTLKMFLVGRHKNLQGSYEYNNTVLEHIVEGLYHYLLKEEVLFNKESVIDGIYTITTLTNNDRVIKVKYNTANREVYIIENTTMLSDNSIIEEILIAMEVKELKA